MKSSRGPQRGQKRSDKRAEEQPVHGHTQEHPRSPEAAREVGEVSRRAQAGPAGGRRSAPAFPPDKGALKPDLDDFQRYIRDERAYSEHTLRNYLSDLDQFVAFLIRSRGTNDLCWDQVDPLAIRGFLAELHDENKATSRARKLSSLRSFFRFMVKRGRLPVNIAALIDKPRLPTRQPTFLPIDEMFGLIQVPDCDQHLGLRDRAILEVLYGGGLRVSELTGLNLEHLTLKDRLIRVRGKGRKERIVPIGRPAVAALEAYLRVRGTREGPSPDPFALFLNARGGRLTSRSVGRLVHHYGLLAGILRQFGPHALRHTYATHLLAGGADLRAIQEMLGHASLSSTQKYTHVAVEKLMEIYDRTHPHA